MSSTITECETKCSNGYTDLVEVTTTYGLTTSTNSLKTLRKRIEEKLTTFQFASSSTCYTKTEIDNLFTTIHQEIDTAISNAQQNVTYNLRSSNIQQGAGGTWETTISWDNLTDSEWGLVLGNTTPNTWQRITNTTQITLTQLAEKSTYTFYLRDPNNRTHVEKISFTTGANPSTGGGGGSGDSVVTFDLKVTDIQPTQNGDWGATVSWNGSVVSNPEWAINEDFSTPTSWNPISGNAKVFTQLSGNSTFRFYLRDASNPDHIEYIDFTTVSDTSGGGGGTTPPPDTGGGSNNNTNIFNLSVTNIQPTQNGNWGATVSWNSSLVSNPEWAINEDFSTPTLWNSIPDSPKVFTQLSGNSTFRFYLRDASNPDYIEYIDFTTVSDTSGGGGGGTTTTPNYELAVSNIVANSYDDKWSADFAWNNTVVNPQWGITTNYYEPNSWNDYSGNSITLNDLNEQTSYRFYLRDANNTSYVEYVDLTTGSNPTVTPPSGGGGGSGGDINDGTNNMFYSVVTDTMVPSYMSRSPFFVLNEFNYNTDYLTGGGSVDDLVNAIDALKNKGGGTLYVSGTYTGNYSAGLSGDYKVRVIGEGDAEIRVTGGDGSSFSDDYSGFVFRNAYNVSLEKLTVYSNSGHGILVFGGCNNIRITQCHITHSVRSSIILYSSANYTTSFEVSGNICENFGNENPVGGNSHHGIETRYVKKGLIIGNYVDGSKNVGWSRMGLDNSSETHEVETCYNKLYATNYGAKIGYATTGYVHFHHNEIHPMNDGNHSDRSFYIHRTLGDPVYYHDNKTYDDYLQNGDITFNGAGCDGSGIVYYENNTDIYGNGINVTPCGQDINGTPPQSLLDYFKNMYN